MDNKKGEGSSSTNNGRVSGIVNVLIADDHKIIRDGMKMVLNSVPTHQYVVFEADGYDSAVNLLNNSSVHIDIAFVDYRMGKTTGDELVRYIASKHPEIKTVGISNYDESAYVFKMVHAGAKGYVLKNIGVDELQNCIDKVLTGKRYFSEDIKGKLDDTKEGTDDKVGEEGVTIVAVDDKGQKEQLNDREIRIIRMIAKELTNEEIAEALCVSKRTVDNQRMSIMQRLNVRNTAGLVRFAFQNGLIE